MASIRVLVDQSGAAVLVDERYVGTSPVTQELWLDPGKHSVEARPTTGEPQKKDVALAAGQSEQVTLNLLPTPAPAPHTSIAPPPRAARRVEARPSADGQASSGSLRTPVLLGGGVLTVTAVAVGIVFAVRAGQASDDVTRLGEGVDLKATDPRIKEGSGGCRATPQSPQCAELARRVDDVVQSRNIETAAFVTGGVLGIATAAAYFLWPKAGARETRASLSSWNEGSAHGVEFSVCF